MKTLGLIILMDLNDSFCNRKTAENKKRERRNLIFSCLNLTA